MPLIFRRTIRFGPLRWHFGRTGFTSWGIKIGPWSWNSRARAHRVDLPGPMAWTSKRHTTRRRSTTKREPR